MTQDFHICSFKHITEVESQTGEEGFGTHFGSDEISAPLRSKPER
jgi:hypothetical protein